MEYLLFIFLWVVWCAIHSGMISIKATTYLQNTLGDKYRFYRLAYNLIAIFTLLPIYLFGKSIVGDAVLRWPEILEFLRYLMLFFSLLLFYVGARKYDMLQFLGIRQIRSGESHMSLLADDELDTSGILSVTRHPWYLATLIFIWVFQNEMNNADVIMRLILTAYLFIGTLLEERKLIQEYGDDYRKYMQQVSMIFPTKWLVSKISGSSKS